MYNKNIKIKYQNSEKGKSLEQYVSIIVNFKFLPLDISGFASFEDVDGIDIDDLPTIFSLKQKRRGTYFNILTI